MIKVSTEEYRLYLREKTAELMAQVEKCKNIQKKVDEDIANFKRLHPIKEFFGYLPDTVYPISGLPILNYRINLLEEKILFLADESIKIYYVELSGEQKIIVTEMEFFRWYKEKYL